MASWQLTGRFITATKHFPDFQLPRAQHSQTRHISICFFFFNSKRKSTINIFAHQSQTSTKAALRAQRQSEERNPSLPLPILSLLPHLVCFRASAPIKDPTNPIFLRTMPASPSFPSGTHPNLNPFSLLNNCIYMCFEFDSGISFFSFSETRTRWKKRKREPQISRRAPKHEDDDEDEEEPPPAHDDDGVELQDDPDEPQSGAVSLHESEVLSDGGARVCDFPLVVKHTVNRPHSSVMAIVAAERANQSGESGKRAQQLHAALLALENVSYGQLQALSAVPADAPVFDQDRTDGAVSGSSFVITPPQIMEGRGVVKRFGSRVLVVPMHSGRHAYTYTFTYTHNLLAPDSEIVLVESLRMSEEVSDFELPGGGGLSLFSFSFFEFALCFVCKVSVSSVLNGFTY